jgi:small conductance mechanosensitive channel
VVEKMTLRVVVLRDLKGTMHIVPNSEIKVVSNMTRGWSRAVVDVGITYEEDIDKALAVVRDEAAQFSTDKVWGAQLDGPLEVPGIESLSDSSVVVRTLIRTQPGSQWNAAREFRRRLKKRLDREGISIPYPQRKVHVTVQGGAASPEVVTAGGAAGG